MRGRAPETDARRVVLGRAEVDVDRARFGGRERRGIAGDVVRPDAAGLDMLVEVLVSGGTRRMG